MIPPEITVAQSKKRKKVRTTAQTQKKSKTSKQSTRSTAYRSGKRRSAGVARFTAERERLKQTDSARLFNGGTEPITMGKDVKHLSSIEIEPILTRFRRGDTTLTMSHIESLYFGREAQKDDASFLSGVESASDASIKGAKYNHAYSLVRGGLWRNPFHLALLKRACDLAQHLQSPNVDLHIWQITEILNLIAHTGNGKTMKEAYRVMSTNDALLFETLWLETDNENIQSYRTSTHEGKPLFIIEILEVKQRREPGIATPITIKERTTRYYRIMN